MDIKVTSADGTRLVARRTGHGVPVVLVHGSAGGLDSWDPITPLLAGEFELWVYARRGYSPSGDVTRPKTYADDVADLRAVLEAAGGSAHVAGASYGGTVVLHALAQGGAGIRTAAVFEPPLFAAGPALSGTLGRYRALLDAGDLAAATRLFAERVSRVPAVLLAAFDGAATDPREAAGCLHDLEAMTADDILGWDGIDVPLLIMQGSDTWEPMPETMDALTGALPGASREVLPGQSHFATHTAPELFAGRLRAFFS